MSKCETKYDKNELAHVCAAIRRSENLGRVDCRIRGGRPAFYSGRDLVGMIDGGKVTVISNGNARVLDSLSDSLSGYLKGETRSAGRPSGRLASGRGGIRTAPRSMGKMLEDARRVADSWVSEVVTDDLGAPLPVGEAAMISGTNGHSYLAGPGTGGASAPADVTDILPEMVDSMSRNRKFAERAGRKRGREQVSEEVSFALRDQWHRGMVAAARPEPAPMPRLSSCEGHSAAPEPVTCGSSLLACITRCEGGSLVQIMEEETSRFEKEHSGDEEAARAGLGESQTACTEQVGEISEDFADDSPAQQKPRDSYASPVRRASSPRLRIPRTFKPREFDPAKIDKSAKPDVREIASRMFREAGMDPTATTQPDVPYQDTEDPDVYKACASLDVGSLNRLSRDLQRLGCYADVRMAVRRLVSRRSTRDMRVIVHEMFEDAGIDSSATASPDVPYEDAPGPGIVMTCASLDTASLRRLHADLVSVGCDGPEPDMVRALLRQRGTGRAKAADGRKPGMGDMQRTASAMIAAAGMDPKSVMSPEVPYEDESGNSVAAACASLGTASLSRLHGDLERLGCDGIEAQVVGSLLRQRRSLSRLDQRRELVEAAKVF